MASNKVTFGLDKVHYAVITENQDGSYSYGTPVRIPGAVSLTETPTGESTKFYADNGVYYATSANQGYEMTLTFAKIPDHFRVNVLGDTIVNGGLYENADAKQKAFALLFEIDGDIEADKFVYYNCTATRPGVSSNTKAETTEPNTNELTITAAPRTNDKAVRWITGENTKQNIKDKFYDQVIEPVYNGGLPVVVRSLAISDIKQPSGNTVVQLNVNGSGDVVSNQSTFNTYTAANEKTAFLLPVEKEELTFTAHQPRHLIVVGADNNEEKVAVVAIGSDANLFNVSLLKTGGVTRIKNASVSTFNPSATHQYQNTGTYKVINSASAVEVLYQEGGEFKTWYTVNKGTYTADTGDKATIEWFTPRLGAIAGLSTSETGPNVMKAVKIPQ